MTEHGARMLDAIRQTVFEARKLSLKHHTYSTQPPTHFPKKIK